MEPMIRLLGPGDAHLLADPAEDVFDAEILPDLLAACLENPDHAFAVAILEGRVVGQARAILNRQPDAATALFLDNLGVTPALKRRGIATRLVRCLMTWGRERGCTGIWVPVEADNPEALGFYDSMGFERRPIVMASAPIGD